MSPDSVGCVEERFDLLQGKLGCRRYLFSFVRSLRPVIGGEISPTAHSIHSELELPFLWETSTCAFCLVETKSRQVALCVEIGSVVLPLLITCLLWAHPPSPVPLIHRLNLGFYWVNSTFQDILSFIFYGINMCVFFFFFLEFTVSLILCRKLFLFMDPDAFLYSILALWIYFYF